MQGYREFEWEIKESRHGEPTLLLGGRAVYSQYEPIKSSEELAHRLMGQITAEHCTHLILIGQGLGYLPRALFGLGFKDIIVWEPFPVMQQSFPICDGAWQKGITVVFTFNDFKSVVDRFAQTGAKPKIIIHHGYQLFCRLEYRCVIQYLDTIYAVNEERSIVSQRSLETLVRLPFLRTIQDFAGIYKNKSVVLVSPGPSLKKYVSKLKNIKNCVLLAAMQAVPFLQKNGVRVNGMVYADPQDATQFWADCSDDFDAFFAETCVAPSMLDRHKDKTFLFHFKSDQVHEKPWAQAGLPILDDPVATVSETMLLLAAYMDFKEIYCVGMDFCWLNERYAYRTPNPYDAYNAPLEQKFNTVTYNDQVATTEAVYFHAVRFMQMKCAALKAGGKKVYQASDGMAFDATAVLGPDEFEKRMHETTGLLTFTMPAAPAVSIKAEHMRALITDLAKETPARTKNQTDGVLKPKSDLWPVLQEIPAGKKAELCARYLRELPAG